MNGFDWPAPPKRAADVWQGEAMVLYARALFVARFSIRPDGMVSMEQDEPLASDYIRERFVSSGRLFRYQIGEEYD